MGLRNTVGWMGALMSSCALAVWELALVVVGIRRQGVLVVAAAVWRRKLRTCLLLVTTGIP